MEKEPINILTQQSLHPIEDCLKQLKFNRPAAAQRLIDELITIVKNRQ